MKEYLNACDIGIILCMNKDKLTIIKEYGETMFGDRKEHYPVDYKKLIKIGLDFHLQSEYTIYTYKGHVYIKCKHNMDGTNCLVTWLRSSKNVYTAYNIRMKVKEVFCID